MNSSAIFLTLSKGDFTEPEEGDMRRSKVFFAGSGGSGMKIKRQKGG
jgi:hypothetical protein